ncbi:MAG: DUF4065 domain-containing protein [Clostridium sp.]
MLQDVNVAKYFLGKDTERKLFNKTLVHRCGRDFYEGNARLNKYLHLAQNIYIAKTGNKLFSEDLYAYDNGAVSPSVQENYSVLLSRTDVPEVSPEIKAYLDKIYTILQNASLDELIELSHEDSEWIGKHGHYGKANQRMNSLAHAAEYAAQYKDILKVMDRLAV